MPQTAPAIGADHTGGQHRVNGADGKRGGRHGRRSGVGMTPLRRTCQRRLAPPTMPGTAARAARQPRIPGDPFQKTLTPPR